MNKSIGIIQARMSSSRFPGKVLELLGGLPSIVFMTNRARRAATLDAVVVATSDHESDDPLASVLRDFDVPCYRGSLNDVLSRYSDAAKQYGATEIVRLTGDCPLIDPAIIDGVVRLRRERAADYASNVEPPSFPDGLDVECFSRQALERAFGEARLAPHREHVTVWMREDGSGLKRCNFQGLVNASALRLTVDYPDDLAAVRRLVDLVGRPPAEFDFFDMMRTLSAHPDILTMNPHARNEGLQKSLDLQ